MGPVSFSALLAAAPMALTAQWQGSLGAGTGIVRYTGGSGFGAFTLAPIVQRVTPASFFSVSGGVSLLEAGAWAGQGRADGWAATSRRTSGTRAAISVTLAGSTRSDGVGAGSATGVIEAVWSGARAHGAGGAAFGAGAVTGVIEGVPGVGAFRLRARGWWLFDKLPPQFSLTVESTRFIGAWYTDVTLGATVDQRRVVGSMWVSGRASAAYGSSGAANATLQYFVGPALALEASGGSYLRDPFQGLPRAGFVAGGIRFFTSRRALGPEAGELTTPALAPLVAQHRGGDTVVVRFRMAAARSVSIAGNWNAWTPAPLRGLGDDIWEAALLLPPGTYYFNLVVDGREWVVPGGVATISDGMGGLIAVLNVL
jgi:AMP-activated protein kinase-like protein